MKHKSLEHYTRLYTTDVMFLHRVVRILINGAYIWSDVSNTRPLMYVYLRAVIPDVRTAQ
jgi:hypothetical protein